MPVRKSLSAQRVRSIAERRHLRADLAVSRKERPRLDIVLKADSVGSVEALSALLANINVPEAEIRVIHSAVGPVSKQDLHMALTGSRLVVGFTVGVSPRLEQWVKEHGVEIRLYDVIYRLAEDLKNIARSLAVPEPEDKVTGKCQVIATFKSVKGGVILGCEVVEGTVQVGKNFRVVTAMGPVHSSRIESLQIEKQNVKEARSGQQVGIKVAGFTDGKPGDFIECYEVLTARKSLWTPKGSIIQLKN